MGYFINHAIAVSGYDVDVEAAHAKARECFADVGLDGLVGGVQQHAMNGGAAFFISPDGSKEGWGHSKDGDTARDAFTKYLRGTHLNWAVIVLGGDDGIYKVIDSPEGPVGF